MQIGLLFINTEYQNVFSRLDLFSYFSRRFLYFYFVFNTCIFILFTRRKFPVFVLKINIKKEIIVALTQKGSKPLDFAQMNY